MVKIAYFCRDFFATYSPYGDLIDAVTNPPPLCQNDVSLVRTKAPDIEQFVDLELSEIYHGAIKKMKITREEFIDEAQVRTKIVEERLTVPIPAGIPSGARIRFEGAGNCSPQSFPSDIVFVVRERPHERYRREGADLHVEVPITLKDALVGFPLELIGVDGTWLLVQIVDVVHPGYEKVLKGEGLPIPGADGPVKRGDMHITFTSKQRVQTLNIQKHDICVYRHFKFEFCNTTSLFLASFPDFIPKDLRDKFRVLFDELYQEK